MLARLLATTLSATFVHAHLAPWHKGMYGLNVRCGHLTRFVLFLNCFWCRVLRAPLTITRTMSSTRCTNCPRTSGGVRSLFLSVGRYSDMLSLVHGYNGVPNFPPADGDFLELYVLLHTTLTILILIPALPANHSWSRSRPTVARPPSHSTATTPLTGPMVRITLTTMCVFPLWLGAHSSYLLRLLTLPSINRTSTHVSLPPTVRY